MEQTRSKDTVEYLGGNDPGALLEARHSYMHHLINGNRCVAFRCCKLDAFGVIHVKRYIYLR